MELFLVYIITVCVVLIIWMDVAVVTAHEVGVFCFTLKGHLNVSFLAMVAAYCIIHRIFEIKSNKNSI